MARSMQHLNGNLLCAVDVETTGFIAGKHDLIQVAVLPLDSNIEPIRDIAPFYFDLQPKRPENFDAEAAAVNKLGLAELMLKGVDPWKACDLFVEWFERLGLGLGKKIVALAHNWQFDKSFLEDWLGKETFNAHFDFHPRDSMNAASFLNDRADFHNEKIPFPKVSLKYCCSQFKIQNEQAHNALADCIATAAVYRRMLMMPIM